MLRPRGCDRPKPIKELGEGAGEWGLTELRAGPPDCSSPSTPTPAFKICNFPLMGKYSRGLRSGVYDGKKKCCKEQSGRGSGVSCSSRDRP